MDNYSYFGHKKYKMRFNKLIGVLLIWIITLLFIAIYIMDNKYAVAIFIYTVLVLTIISFFLLKEEIVIFEPIVLFSMYYIFIALSGYYFIFTNYKSTEFVIKTNFSKNIVVLTNYASFYYLIGYIFTLLGYYLFIKKDKRIEIRLELPKEISDISLNIIIILFLMIGIANFTYNIFKFSSGNLFLYMANVSIRDLEFSIFGGTTLGYIFAYNSMYVWLFKIYRRNEKLNMFFYIFLIITIMMKASTGRIFDTILYFGSFIGIYYFFSLSKNKHVNNKKYIFFGVFAGIFGLIFYFLRIISSLSYNKMLKHNVISTFISLIRNLPYYAIDKGNIPNVSVFLKIIDSWGKDIGFLYGRSLFSWIFNFLPSSIRPTGYQPSIMIKNTWYSHIQSGALPPTGIGEMYANFGILGPILGMFLFGAFIALLYNYFLNRKSYWVLAMYIQIAIGFVFLYPKGEFDNLSLWYIIPLLLIEVVLKIISVKPKEN